MVDGSHHLRPSAICFGARTPHPPFRNQQRLGDPPHAQARNAGAPEIILIANGGPFRTPRSEDSDG
jgi:hypothetical protein